MKNTFYIKKNLILLSTAFLIVFSIISCNSEYSSDDSNLGNNTNPPEITSVSEAREDVVVTQGVLESTYIIRGKNLGSMRSIHFNGLQAGFNPAYLTDEIAFVKVPEDAPYVGQENIMRVETLGGVINYDFSLLTIEEFTEGTIDGVKVVNLIGGDFTDTDTVTFVSGNEEDGNLIELPADILSISETVVVAEVPPGVEQAFIFLKTYRGAIVKSDSYGFSYSIFIDELNPDWDLGGWGGTQDPTETGIALGTHSIKRTSEAWAGLTFLPINGNIDFNAYESISISIYGTGAPGDTVLFALNDFATSIPLTLVPGEWTKFVIPLSDWYPNGGEPDEIFRIDFQESSNTGLSEYIFYVDEFGFI